MSVDKNIQILVVEDNQNIQSLLVNLLSSVGFNNVSKVDDGNSAWTLLEENKFDLILTDITMKSMSGIELLEKIRSSDLPFKDIPLIIITASDKKEHIVDAIKWKVNGYIVKPINSKTILQKINDARDG